MLDWSNIDWERIEEKHRNKDKIILSLFDLTGNWRSKTPMGFAYAFYEANK